MTPEDELTGGIIRTLRQGLINNLGNSLLNDDENGMPPDWAIHLFRLSGVEKAISVLPQFIEAIEGCEGNITDIRASGQRAGTISALFLVLRHYLKEFPRLQEQLSKETSRGEAEISFITNSILAECSGQFTNAIDNGETQYLLEFTKAFSMHLDNCIGELEFKTTTATPIYIALSLHWPTIEKIKNLPSLHSWLCKQIGSQLVGDEERIKKLLQRAGVKLFKPGRPKNRDT